MDGDSIPLVAPCKYDPELKRPIHGAMDAGALPVADNIT
jgi:hypothetical protein